MTAPQRKANHIIDLHLAASAHAARTLDAGIEVHGHRGMRNVTQRLLAAQCFEFVTHLHLHAICPFAQLAMLTHEFRSP